MLDVGVRCVTTLGSSVMKVLAGVMALSSRCERLLSKEARGRVTDSTGPHDKILANSRTSWPVAP